MYICTHAHTRIHKVIMTCVFTFSCMQSCKQKTPFPNRNFFEMHFETVQKTIMERFDALVTKLGCAEKKTLMKELRSMFFSEVKPLRESFQQVYSKVFTPQIEEVDVSYISYTVFKNTFYMGLVYSHIQCMCMIFTTCLYIQSYLI